MGNFYKIPKRESIKAIAAFTVLAGTFAIQSCGDHNSSPSSKEDYIPLSLAGKVYGACASVDSLSGQATLPFIGDLPTLLFINDSNFIREIPVQCNDIGKNFICMRYYSGTYKTDDKSLVLTFGPEMITQIRTKADPGNKSLPPYAQVERERSDLRIERLPRHDFKNISCFEICDAQGHLMAPKADTIANRINFLKAVGIWDELMNKHKLQ